MLGMSADGSWIIEGHGRLSGSVRFSENESFEGLHLETLHASPAVSPEVINMNITDELS